MKMVCSDIQPSRTQSISASPSANGADSLVSCVMLSNVKVTHLYEGTKSFWRLDRNATFIIFSHKVMGNDYSTPSCIEVVTYVSAINPNAIGSIVEVPRLYLSPVKIFSKLKQSDLQIGGLTVVEGSSYANKLISSYIFSRIAIVSVPTESSSEKSSEEHSFRVELHPIGEDSAMGESFKSSKSAKFIDAKYDGVVNNDILGQLPHIDNIT